MPAYSPFTDPSTAYDAVIAICSDPLEVDLPFSPARSDFSMSSDDDSDDRHPPAPDHDPVILSVIGNPVQLPATGCTRCAELVDWMWREQQGVAHAEAADGNAITRLELAEHAQECFAFAGFVAEIHHVPDGMVEMTDAGTDTDALAGDGTDSDGSAEMMFEEQALLEWDVLLSEVPVARVESPNDVNLREVSEWLEDVLGRELSPDFE